MELSSLNHIDVLIYKGKVDVWRFMGFYGHPMTQRRVESWNLMRSLHGRFSAPWLCADDFNEITKTHEKKGGRLRPYYQMNNFRDALDECGLMDLGFVGSKYTWFKNFGNEVVVWEHLYRALGTTDWLDIYPAKKVLILECGMLDHKPMIIHLGGVPMRPNKPWRFEQMWLEDEGCHDTVASAWRDGEGSSPMSRVLAKVGKCQTNLKWWSKRYFGNITWEIVDKKRKMKEAEVSAVNGGNVEYLVQLKNELASLIVKEEQMWQQRSKSHWMKLGDKNSKYFHTKPSQRFRRNWILELENSMGVMCMGDDYVARLL